MNNLIAKAHAYLDDKGCKSIGQKYTAFEIERMLAEFAEQQIRLLDLHNVTKSVCPKCEGKGDYYKNIENGRILVVCECQQTVL